MEKIKMLPTVGKTDKPSRNKNKKNLQTNITMEL